MRTHRPILLLAFGIGLKFFGKWHTWSRGRAAARSPAVPPCEHVRGCPKCRLPFGRLEEDPWTKAARRIGAQSHTDGRWHEARSTSDQVSRDANVTKLPICALGPTSWLEMTPPMLGLNISQAGVARITVTGRSSPRRKGDPEQLLLCPPPGCLATAEARATAWVRVTGRDVELGNDLVVVRSRGLAR